MESARQIYTVGHSTRSWSEFLELLAAREIRCLVDVRRFPGSRRFPQFNRTVMETALRTAGTDYAHEADLGGRRSPRPDSPNTYWRVAQFRGFADYQSSANYETAIDRLQHRAAKQRVAVMCAEAVPWRCHRQLIADDLTLRGWNVFHILSANRVDLHVLNPAIRAKIGEHFYYSAKADD